MPENERACEGEMGGMEHEAVFHFRCPHAETLFRSLSPEMAAELHPRSRGECFMEGQGVLVLKVQARDCAALRAALNMWLRLVNVADEMQALASPAQKERS
ncbi:MAG TPA: KEOPS complex subunit Pcc1 [Methanolinea sp.]|nr:KEOPS complex subunit Pcc1 [Methanolinea sp.]